MAHDSPMRMRSESSVAVGLRNESDASPAGILQTCEAAPARAHKKPATPASASNGGNRRGIYGRQALSADRARPQTACALHLHKKREAKAEHGGQHRIRMQTQLIKERDGEWCRDDASEGLRR
jgi:hypothetical protein